MEFLTAYNYYIKFFWKDIKLAELSICCYTVLLYERRLILYHVLIFIHLKKMELPWLGLYMYHTVHL